MTRTWWRKLKHGWRVPFWAICSLKPRIPTPRTSQDSSFNEPIRYLINTHHHCDHSGGVRTYASEGITIITHQMNKAYYEDNAKNTWTLAPDKLATNKKKINIETMTDKTRSCRRLPPTCSTRSGRRIFWIAHTDSPLCHVRLGTDGRLWGLRSEIATFTMSGCRRHSFRRSSHAFRSSLLIGTG